MECKLYLKAVKKTERGRRNRREGKRRKSVLDPNFPQPQPSPQEMQSHQTPSSSQPSPLFTCLCQAQPAPHPCVPHNQPLSSPSLHRRCPWIPCPSTPTWSRHFSCAGPPLHRRGCPRWHMPSPTQRFCCLFPQSPLPVPSHVHLRLRLGQHRPPV